MITKEQALIHNTFHLYFPEVDICCVFRRIRPTKTWKTRPAEFMIDVMWELNLTRSIRDNDQNYYTPQECPKCN